MSLDGDRASLAFDQEVPEGLWIGGRDANTVVLRGSDASSPAAVRYNSLPPGHPQGYQGSFNAFVADACRAIDGDLPDGLPTFEDGRRGRRHHERGAPSARSQSWAAPRNVMAWCPWCTGRPQQDIAVAGTHEPTIVSQCMGDKAAGDVSSLISVPACRSAADGVRC
jgi:hypothetical protein